MHSHINTLQSKPTHNKSNKLHQSMHSFDSTLGISANTALLIWEHLHTAAVYVQLWLNCICRQAHAEFSTVWDSIAKQDVPVSTLIIKLSSNYDCGHKRGQRRVVLLPLIRGWPLQQCLLSLGRRGVGVGSAAAALHSSRLAETPPRNSY